MLLPDVVGDDGRINRKALGAKVFADKSRLQVLNKIVWPEIARMAQEQIKQLRSKGNKYFIYSIFYLKAHFVKLYCAICNDI